jgi:hypothetical protein
MIPDDAPDCRCSRITHGDNCPEGFQAVLYTWELRDSTGIVWLAIDPDCPLHAEYYLQGT